MPQKILDRTMYRKVKNMDQKEMTNFLNNIYDAGVRDADAAGISREQIREKLSTVEGIGEKRLNAIMEALEDLFMA